MRLLVLAVSLSALAAGSFWVLTQGPLAPRAAVAPSSEPVRVGVRTADPGGVVVAPPSPTPAPRPRVRVVSSDETYAVTGRTAPDVLRSLLDNGPRQDGSVFFGLTETELDVRYDPREVSGGCLVEDTEVTLQVVVSLPEWMPAGEVDPALSADWRRFRRALTAHEHRHRQIAVEGAEAAYRAVAGLFRGSCEAVVAEAQGRLERHGIEVTARHHRYDDETSHGKTEGAVWPTR